MSLGVGVEYWLPGSGATAASVKTHKTLKATHPDCTDMQPYLKSHWGTVNASNYNWTDGRTCFDFLFIRWTSTRRVKCPSGAQGSAVWNARLFGWAGSRQSCKQQHQRPDKRPCSTQSVSSERGTALVSPMGGELTQGQFTWIYRGMLAINV